MSSLIKRKRVREVRMKPDNKLILKITIGPNPNNRVGRLIRALVINGSEKVRVLAKGAKKLPQYMGW